MGLGAQQVDGGGGGELCAAVEGVEALDEPLEHELLRVRPVGVEGLVPDEEEARAVELDVLGVAGVEELLEDAADAAHLPALVQLLGLQQQDFLSKETQVFTRITLTLRYVTRHARHESLN